MARESEKPSAKRKAGRVGIVPFLAGALCATALLPAILLLLRTLGLTAGAEIDVLMLICLALICILVVAIALEVFAS